MNLIKLVNPLHVARELLHRVVAAAETLTEVVRRPDAPQPQAHRSEPPLRGADTVEFAPSPPAEPPVDVVGMALAGAEGRVTGGGAVVEPHGPAQGSAWGPAQDDDPDGPLIDPGEAKALATEHEVLRRAAD